MATQPRCFQSNLKLHWHGATECSNHACSCAHRMICSSRPLLQPSTSRLPSALRAMSWTASGRFHLHRVSTVASHTLIHRCTEKSPSGYVTFLLRRLPPLLHTHP